jgi:TATA-box binding protein (TBP) (component of TFIID and TFIIIB)
VWRILAWRKKKSRNERSSISQERLQSAITEAVKKADPACEAFAGVIVQRETPKEHFDVNWSIRGVRFGRADREKSKQALANIVERMQRELRLAEDGPAEPPKSMAIEIGRSNPFDR